MPNTRQDHQWLRRRLRALLVALRPAWWDADHTAAALNGWTVERARFGRVVVRDRRCDQLPRHAGDLVAAEQAARAPALAGSGRWQP